jgi:hypothetical protein
MQAEILHRLQAVLHHHFHQQTSIDPYLPLLQGPERLQFLLPVLLDRLPLVTFHLDHLRHLALAAVDGLRVRRLRRRPLLLLLADDKEENDQRRPHRIDKPVGRNARLRKKLQDEKFLYRNPVPYRARNQEENHLRGDVRVRSNENSTIFPDENGLGYRRLHAIRAINFLRKNCSVEERR